jgi:hypothetical protein
LSAAPARDAAVAAYPVGLVAFALAAFPLLRRPAGAPSRRSRARTEPPAHRQGSIAAVAASPDLEAIAVTAQTPMDPGPFA